MTEENTPHQSLAYIDTHMYNTFNNSNNNNNGNNINRKKQGKVGEDRLEPTRGQIMGCDSDRR